MTILVILAHPSPNSFNHAIAGQVCTTIINNGHEVIFHDLYTEKFDPLLPADEIVKNAKLDDPIEKHCQDLVSSDGIVIVHPNWWGSPPAILKGWIDRIIRPGVAYKFVDGDSGEGVPVGLLKAKTAVVLNTSDTSEKREIEIFGDPLERIWKDCIFDLCGVKEFHRRMFRIIVTSTLEERKQWLAEASNIIEQCFPKVV